MMRRALLVLSITALFVTACTALIGLDDVPPTPVRDAGPTTMSAEASATDGGDLMTGVKTYALAYCTRYKDCSGPLFEFNYRDVDECTTSILGYPIWSAALPGSLETGAVYEDCARNVAKLTCTQFSSSDFGFACAPKGAKKVNDRCLSNAQCASGFCGSDNDNCRGCIELPANGSPCASGSQCGPGLTCNGSDTCVTESLTDQACSADKPCAYPNGCIDSKCAPLPATLGAGCSNTNGGCDSTKGFICSTATSTCVTYQISGQGGPCSSTGTDFKLCRRAAVCTGGICGGFPAVGEPCATDNSKPSCLAPLICIGGVCAALPASSTCQ